MMSFIFMLMFILDLGSVKKVKAEAKKSTKNVNNITAKKSKRSNITTSNVEDKEKEMKELDLDSTLMKARWMHQYSDLIAEIERLRLKKEYQRLYKEIAENTFCNEDEKEIRLLNMQKEKLIAELELIQAQCDQQMIQSSIQVASLEKKAQLARAGIQVLAERKNRLQAEIDSFQIEAQRYKYIKKNTVYLKDPIRKKEKDNILVLSDRCIQLNGYIGPWVANKVSDQIQYFNNTDITYPIFIIIGESPGGEVFSGWHIIQSMKHSKAPVYVVLKRFAASMAACIVTLAPKSYALPNATILHHQPRAWAIHGSARECKESSQKLQEVWKRTGGLIAKKMGISLKKFEKRMYKKSVQGNWEAYADDAKKLKWVDEVIDGIEDSSMNIIMSNLNDYKL